MSDSVPTAAAADVRDWDSAGPTAPNPARMYDYYLGGKDNFRVDRDAAEKAVAAAPVIPVLARANRAFLVDAVEKMAAAGISRYLDIGSGLPTSPNVHEVASAAVPNPRVVYMDIDPVVVAHSRVIRGRSGTATVCADLRSPAAVFGAPEVGRLIDFGQPVGLLIRTTAEIRELFTGFELLPPGLTDVRTYTDPAFVYSPEASAPGLWMLCANGRKL
jgi:hypothetical protein